MTRRALCQLVLLPLAGGCRGGAPPEIRIGLLANFTGPYADASGRPTLNGARLALLTARVRGEVVLDGKRYRVTLVERDFEDRADAAASAARALINQEHVIALIGPQFSRHAIPVAVLAEDAQVPMISPMSSNPAVTAGKRFVFRLAFLDDVQGDVLARFATVDLRARRAAVLYDISTAYSRELAERFRRAFERGGGVVAAFETYTADRAQDFRPQLARIRAARADLLLLPNFPDAVARQIVQARQLGVRAVFLGSDSWDPQAVPLPPGDTAYVTNQWRPDLPSPAAQRFVTLYRQTYGAEPRAAAAMTFDAVGILLESVRRARGTDPESLRVAIASLDGYEGASGTLGFAGRQDPRRGVGVSAVRAGGRFTTVRIIQP